MKRFRQLCAAGALAICVGPALADFEGDYAPNLWGFYLSTVYEHAVADSSSFVDLSDSSLRIVGPNAGVGNVSHGAGIFVSEDAEITFDWTYLTEDPYPGLDSAIYYVDGAPTLIATNSFGATQTGVLTISVEAGQELVLAVRTADGIEGAGTLIIEDFEVSAAGANAADLDRDGDVDSTDLAILLGDFGCLEGCGISDMNQDGVVDSTDLALLLGAFGS